MNIHELFHELMEQAAAGAEAGYCTCSIFPHVSRLEGWTETASEIIDTMYEIVRLSSPAEAEGNLGHFLTVVMAMGYTLGVSDTYDTVSVSVPDSLAGLDFIEARPGDSGQAD